MWAYQARVIPASWFGSDWERWVWFFCDQGSQLELLWASLRVPRCLGPFE